MAKIDDGVMKKWFDGEIVFSSDYVQEREMLRYGINDNFDRLIKNFKVLASDGSVITTKTLDKVFNYINFQEGNKIKLSLDEATATLQISLSNEAFNDIYTKSEVDSKLGLKGLGFLDGGSFLDTFSSQFNKIDGGEF